MSNSLNSDQALHFVGPDLGSDCLQRLSADDKSRHSGERVKYLDTSTSCHTCPEKETKPFNYLMSKLL